MRLDGLHGLRGHKQIAKIFRSLSRLTVHRVTSGTGDLHRSVYGPYATPALFVLG